MTNRNEEQQKITVLLVDDHPMVKSGLLTCLEYYDDIDVVGLCNDGKDALNKVKELRPNVILMDVSMPLMNGIDATEIITEQFPDTKVLIFSMHDSSEFVHSAIQAGASGYVLKDTSSEEVYTAIKSVVAGNKHFSNSISKMLIETPLKKEQHKLTTREQVILSYVAQGYSSKEIAKKLEISFRTVEAHRRNIKDKLNIECLADMVRYAIDNGLVKHKEK
jgi:two-component system NarL family response regulator